MPSPELLAWRKARKNLKAFHKGHAKLKGKYLSLRRSLGYLTEHQTLVYSLDHFHNYYIIEVMGKMRAVLKMYEKDLARLQELEQEECRAWAEYSASLPSFVLKEKLHGL